MMFDAKNVRISLQCGCNDTASSRLALPFTYVWFLVEVKRRHSWTSDVDDVHQPERRDVPVPDLVSPCRHVAVSSSSDEEDVVMGQRPSFLLSRSRPKISLTWVLRGEAHQAVVERSTPLDSHNDVVMRADVTTVGVGRPKRALSEPSMGNEMSGRSSRASREKTRHRHRTRTSRHRHRRHSRFGYEINDVNAFLTKASLEKPANIPMVLSSPCRLYLTRLGGYQEEIALPLGMVVNAVFKNQVWLYVQTPHGEEGYVSYASCLPLGILPPPHSLKPPPCWESHTDIFPLPLGNRTDNEKLRDGTRSECGSRTERRARYERDAVSACGERSVDRLYLRAAAKSKRHTLLVIRSDYSSRGRNTLTVAKGDVVVLVSSHLKDWFWVRSRDGNEGFIPSVVGGHGFL